MSSRVWNCIARLQGRTTPRPAKTVDRPREEWTEIAVPAIVGEDTFARVQQRLEDNKKFATRGSKVPSLLQGLAACAACGYGYYRTSTRTARRKICYYRCLGSDNYRYEGGRVCRNKPAPPTTWTRLSGTTSPACSPSRPDPRRDRQTAGAGPHLRPGYPPAHPA